MMLVQTYRWNAVALGLLSLILLEDTIFHAVAAEEITCATGWGNGMQVITPEQINDGYCDCPVDGKDEPGTQACSGSSTWPGMAKQASAESSPVTFSCPQQPNLKLPLSRVNDGICDCCDGTDEAAGTCTDNCEELLRAEREAKAAALKNFNVGSNRRRAELVAFQKLRTEKLHAISTLEQQVASLDNLESIESQIDKLKEAYMMQRMLTLSDVVLKNTAVTDLVGGLEKSELQAFLVHACQVDGEISAEDKESDDTCISLRLAGLDIGMTWGDDNYFRPDMMKIKRKENLHGLAAVLFDNAANDKCNWKMPTKTKPSRNNHRDKRRNNRRRLDDEYNYDYMGEYHDHDHHDYHDHDPYDDEEWERNRAQKDEEVGFEIEGGKKGDMMKTVQEASFSRIRVAFLNRAKEVIGQISKVLDAGDDDDDDKEETENVEGSEDGGAETEAEKVDDKPKVPDNFDPSAYTMVRSSLRRKGNAILKGLKWGASAKIFLEAATDLSDDELTQLVIGTIYHGDLTSLQVWQILQAIVPELGGAEAPPEESCASPWAAACPPTTMRRAGSKFFPSPIIFVAAETFCAQEADLAIEGRSECNEDVSVIPSSIPSSGYYGYASPTPRDENDPLSAFFQPLDSLAVDSDRMDALEAELDALQTKKSELENDIEDALREVGGRDGNELGPEGELHALADKCFDITAGKYTYETCIFGKAAQREGSAKTGGTNLGTWDRMDFDDETGDRIFYWDKGTKCWNGPSRSATVYVTCGAETKLISADEPETCKYVFEMESHIACDDLYRQRMGL